MARFTTLDAAEVAALAAAFELGPVRGFQALDGGTINSNFALDAARGRFFLRVNEGKTEADVAYEAALVAALAAAGVATPAPRVGPGGLPYLAHGARLISVFPWIDGEHAAEPASAAVAGALGAALARLHRAGEPLAGRFAKAGIYTTAHIAARHRGFAASADPALAEAIPLIGDELARLAALAEQRSAAPRGIIHGDLFPDNVLVAPHAPPTIAALLDFEQAAVGSLVYDLAVCLNAWCWAGAMVEPSVVALIAGYQAVRPLGALELALLPIEVRAAAVRFATTRITDVYLARSAVPGKDFRAYLDRLEAWRALGHDWLGWL